MTEEEKEKTRKLTKKAVRDGVLKEKDTCEKCGGKGKWGVVAHHNDYKNHMDITWLCFECHGSIDVKKRWDKHRKERQKLLDLIEPHADEIIFRLIRSKIKNINHLHRLYKSIKAWQKQ